jgi:D-alanine-D-alanine ligase
MSSVKKQVTLICGGPSVEHEVSLRSAQFLLGALAPSRYEPSVIVVMHDGRWLRLRDLESFLALGDQYPFAAGSYDAVMPAIGDKSATWRSLDGLKQWVSDVVIPIIHGTQGEDGALQGVLRWLDLPFVGADILSSALCMDKLMMKSVFQSHQVPVAKWVGFDLADKDHIDTKIVVEALGLPLFVKPASSGSSVGVSKVEREEDIVPAVHEAFRFARRVILEEAVVGREIELSVLGNRDPQVSIAGEIKPRQDFYSYQAKYEDPAGAELLLPAVVPEEQLQLLQEVARQVYRLLRCEGLARIDFFVSDAGRIIVNEVNTLPGFTEISMYPKLLELSGVEKVAMMDSLIACAIARYDERSRLCYRYDDVTNASSPA